MSDNVSWPADFPGKHDWQVSNNNLPPAEKIDSQKELDKYCLGMLTKARNQIAEEYGAHLIEEHLGYNAQSLIQEHGEMESPIAKQGLDIQSAVDRALKKILS